MSRHSVRIPVLVALLVLGSSGWRAESEPRRPDPLTSSTIEWLAGSWQGTWDDDGTEGDGRVFSHWSAPVEGVFSWTFRYHQPHKGHVHFAFSVFEETQEGVVGRGIHHGRDFRTFEQNPWEFRLARASERMAEFVCTKHCRGAAVLLELDDDGRLRESWTSLGSDTPILRAVYERAGVEPSVSPALM